MVRKILSATAILSNKELKKIDLITNDASIKSEFVDELCATA